MGPNSVTATGFREIHKPKEKWSREREREKESATSPARSELGVGTAVGSLIRSHSEDPKEEVRQVSQSGSLERRQSPFLVRPSLLALHFQVLSKNASAGSEAGLPGRGLGGALPARGGARRVLRSAFAGKRAGQGAVRKVLFSKLTMLSRSYCL